VLSALRKGTWTIKLCSNKILQLSYKATRNHKQSLSVATEPAGWPYIQNFGRGQKGGKVKKREGEDRGSGRGGDSR